MMGRGSELPASTELSPGEGVMMGRGGELPASTELSPGEGVMMGRGGELQASTELLPGEGLIASYRRPIESLPSSMRGTLNVRNASCAGYCAESSR